MKIKFWGVRGSHPVADGKFLEVGGNTSCVEVKAGKHRIILDAGTGIIPLGKELLGEYFQSGDSPQTRDPIEAYLFFSHMHYDHNQGLPFFKPAYIESTILRIYGGKFFEEDLIEILRGAMVPPYFPVKFDELRCRLFIQNLHESNTLLLSKEEGPFVMEGAKDAERMEEIIKEHKFSPDLVKISLMKSYAHPKGGVYIYKIENQNNTLVYATDTEGYRHGDQRLIRFAQGADILIHDAQYTPEQYYQGAVPTQGWGHSTYEMACEVAHEAEVKKLYLFHHDPNSDDKKIAEICEKARRIFPDTDYAREGEEIELPLAEDSALRGKS